MQSLRQPPLSPAKRVWLSLLIAAYFLSLLIWNAPTSLPFRNYALIVIRPMLIATGLRQHWDMFAPNVGTTNLHMSALITFADGAIVMYEFPRMEKLGLWQKFTHEKMRKLFVERIPQAQYSSYWTPIAKKLAKASRDQSNQPVLIRLTVNVVEIPPPSNTDSPTKNSLTRDSLTRDSLPEPSLRTTLFVYRVQAEDLK